LLSSTHTHTHTLVIDNVLMTEVIFDPVWLAFYYIYF
jgi:hypothetical protein